ncbi:MAG: flagellar M-ring protein FliF [Steroidobacteraceae bacterium]|jgi:flagellar M-ring protein FliF|nr:flagellar M-ring protein FliF [Steroidobacteraceae bacterium]
MADASSLPARSLVDTVPGLRQLSLLIGVAAAVAAALWLVLWSQGPNYSMLYGRLSDSDAAAVVQALSAAGIQHRLDPGSGAVMVPADRLHDARLTLAGEGLPQGDGLGLEMLRGQEGFGTSQFMESARYQHALETELARTIIRVQGVQAARVHLALPKQSVFIRDRRRASASVMLQLHAGRRLDPGQVSAIVNLVASSVPELEAGQVTVVDQNGTLLSSPREDDGFAATARQLDYQRQLEDRYEQRIEELLGPLVGVGRVRAGVTADVDFTIAERTREDFDREQQVVRSEQTSADARPAGDLAAGIPGALSNQPPATTPAPPAAAQQAGDGAAEDEPAPPMATSQRATRNYEIGRTISHVREPTGSVRRLSVAVILDNKPAPAGAAEADGPAAGVAWTAEELDRFTTIVKEAVGFDEARGDRVQVLNAGFTPVPGLDSIEAPPVWKSPALWSFGRQALGAALVLVLAFVVLRPLMKSITVGPSAGGALVPVPGAGVADLAQDRVTLSRGGAPAANYEQQVAAARSLIGQDPRRAADVVKDWVTADGR